MFKHRQRILLSDEEVGLTMASWAEGKGPGLSLLLTAPSTRLVELIRSQEPKGRSEEEAKAMLILLRSKVTWPAPPKNETGPNFAAISSAWKLQR